MKRYALILLVVFCSLLSYGQEIGTVESCSAAGSIMIDPKNPDVVASLAPPGDLALDPTVAMLVYGASPKPDVYAADLGIDALTAYTIYGLSAASTVYVPQTDMTIFYFDNVSPIQELAVCHYLDVPDTSASYAIPLDLTQTPYQLTQAEVFSKSYMYYYITETDSVPLKEVEFPFEVNSGGTMIPGYVQYIGDGILQFCLDFTAIETVQTLAIELPDTVFNSDKKMLVLRSVPPSFNVAMKSREVTQEINLFAGASYGKNLLLGGVGLGVSASALKFSVSGDGGAKLRFRYDMNGDQYIERGIEAGLALKFSAPSINLVVADAEIGIESKARPSFNLAQTMYFPNSLQSDIAKKAKAAYILETMSIAGAPLSPITAFFIHVVKQSIAEDMAQMTGDIYSDLRYSESWKIKGEGDISGGFSTGGILKMDVIDIGTGASFSLEQENLLQTGGTQFDVECATQFDASLLNGEVLGIQIGSLFQFDKGAGLTMQANYSAEDELKNFSVGFLTEKSGGISLEQIGEINKIEFIVPESTTSLLLNDNNIVASFANVFGPNGQLGDIQFGIYPLLGSLSDVLYLVNERINANSEYITFRNTAERYRLRELSPNIDLDVAFGVGTGINLGVTMSYLNSVSAPAQEYIFAAGERLITSEYKTVSYTDDQMYSLSQELNDLFNEVTYLVMDKLESDVRGLNFIVDAAGSGNLEPVFTEVLGINCRTSLFCGVAQGAGSFVTRFTEPYLSTAYERAQFLVQEQVKAYISTRVDNATYPIPEENAITPELHIVSDHLNLSFITETEEQLDTIHDGFQLKMVLDTIQMEKLGFTEEDKASVQMFYYDADSLTWFPVGEDLSSHPDTILVDATLLGSYALGIYKNSAIDSIAPEITHSPYVEFSCTGGLIWADIHEAQSGSGIDFSQTVIIIDNQEVDCMWDPINKRLSYYTVLSEGSHEVIFYAVDYNGNENTKTIILNVTCPEYAAPSGGEETGREETELKTVTEIETPEVEEISFKCYPNPATDYVNIEVSGVQELLDISVFDVLGRKMMALPLNNFNQATWNVGNTKNGTYFIRVTSKIDEKMDIKVKKVMINK